jgi:MoaA/NifB/PqqE/SkfB family radical SAM enzyme
MDKITYAYLETTNYCNLDCSFCNRTDVIGPLKHMSLEDWGKLLDGIKHHPIQEAKLMGMGEPMLHPQFDEVCRMFKEVFPKCKLIVATNCQYNINDKFRNCMKYIDMLYFSIDGYEENYERDRAPAKWKKLIRFLDQFESVDRHDCNVVVNYVVNAYNVYDIPKIDELRVNYDLGELRLNIAQIWDANTKMSDDVATSGYTKQQLDYLKKNYGGKIMGKSKWDFKDCFWVNNALYTTVEGHVKMCCMNTGATPFGNLFVNSIDEIRQMTDYQNVKKGCNTNNPTSHCKNCSYKELTPILDYVGV